jgi:hypothetical protein
MGWKLIGWHRRYPRFAIGAAIPIPRPTAIHSSSASYSTEFRRMWQYDRLHFTVNSILRPAQPSEWERFMSRREIIIRNPIPSHGSQEMEPIEFRI